MDTYLPSIYGMIRPLTTGTNPVLRTENTKRIRNRNLNQNTYSNNRNQNQKFLT